jgi:hypothetical protein
MKSKMMIVIVAAAVLCGLKVYAHHSFAGTYKLDEQVRIEGKLLRVLLRNPHSYIHVGAANADGQMQEWAIEWGGAAQLARTGVTRDRIRVGDPVIVTGNPSRTPGEPKLRLVYFERPSDGFTWGKRAGEIVE